MESEWIDQLYYCKNCGTTFMVHFKIDVSCPHCGCTIFEIIKGGDLID